jgi:hypothetical protein
MVCLPATSEAGARSCSWRTKSTVVTIWRSGLEISSIVGLYLCSLFSGLDLFFGLNGFDGLDGLWIIGDFVLDCVHFSKIFFSRNFSKKKKILEKFSRNSRNKKSKFKLVFFLYFWYFYYYRSSKKTTSPFFKLLKCIQNRHLLLFYD